MLPLLAAYLHQLASVDGDQHHTSSCPVVRPHRGQCHFHDIVQFCATPNRHRTKCHSVLQAVLCHPTMFFHHREPFQLTKFHVRLLYMCSLFACIRTYPDVYGMGSLPVGHRDTLDTRETILSPELWFYPIRSQVSQGK